jgi:hypothetical protein
MSGRNRRALLRGVCEGGDLPGGAMVDLTGTKLETVDTAKDTPTAHRELLYSGAAVVRCVGRSPNRVNAASLIGHPIGISAGRSFENDQQLSQRYLHTRFESRSGRAHG